ncbi:hypothetical protein [Cellulomonas sp. PhB150]|uniref:hypothetical protein n=1 Tax=Cellulomonas sp. PhB150 TaxID=2485188 RepID=UPI000F4AC009|nr:hypothetical protein [Cellulomonas sp. PhB150]ROS26195.1 hypothetical protein EDF34_2524 [Cellulomonas sp. PhB150]
MRRRVVVATVVGAVLALAGCTGDRDEPSPTGSTGPTPSGSATAATVGDDAASLEGDGLASATFSVPGSPEDTVDVVIQSLVVSGKTTELRVVLTPHFTSVAADDTVTLSDMTDQNLRPVLNDTIGLTQYFVLSNTGLEWETDVSTGVTNGTPVLYQAWFAAPQSRAEVLDLQLTPAWPPFENLPLTYEG